MTAVVVACSAYEGAEDPVGAPDGGSSDAGADAFAPGTDAANTVDGDADAAPSANALIDDDFESGSTCAGWSPFSGATALPVSPGYTGARSCLLCTTGQGQGMTKSLAVDAGGTYAVLGSVRRQADGGAGNVEIELQTYAGPTQTGQAKNPANPSDQWQLTQAVLVAGAGTSGVVVAFIATNALCILVDDVTLTRD